MRCLVLTKGHVAVVDDEDYDWLSQWSWCASVDGDRTVYAVRWFPERRTVGSMHRLILGAPPGMEVDHIDHNGLNNTRANLRLVTRSQNNQNRRRARGTSRFWGVSWDKRNTKWRASIQLDGKTYKLGRFATEEAAARAYDTKALELYGPGARLNFPREGLS